MNNLGSLLRFEIKKIVAKRSIKSLFAVLILMTLYVNCWQFIGTAEIRYLDDSSQVITEKVSILSAVQTERKYALMYSGQSLDDELIQEMKKFVGEHGHDCMNMYWIFHTIYELGLNPEGDLASEAGIAQRLQLQQKAIWSALNLTNNEISEWEDQIGKVELPFQIAYTRGYANMLENAHWLNMMLVFFVIIILCDSFSNDRAVHTLPLIQSSRNGHSSAVVGRILAGLLVVLGAALCVYLLSATIQFGIHGCDGWSAPIQQVCGDLIWSNLAIDAGPAVFLMYGTSIVLLLMVAALTMMLSQFCQNTIVSLAVPFIAICMSMIFNFSITHMERDLSQIWQFFPIQRISMDMFYDHRLVILFGISIRSIPFSFMLYGGIILLAVALCMAHTRIMRMDRQ